MEILIVLLLISHIVLIFLFAKWLKKYKENNYNYIDSALRSIDSSFVNAVRNIDDNVKEFGSNTGYFLDQIKKDNRLFVEGQRIEFEKTTAYIKNDYNSLNDKVKTSNALLLELLTKTQENITKNREIKPILESSHFELEKTYSKIKLLISNYEKNLNDIQGEVQNSIQNIEDTLDDKLKLISTKGEKSIEDSAKLSRETIAHITDETNTKLKQILNNNQVKVLSDQLSVFEQDYRANQKNLEHILENLDESVIMKLATAEKKKGKKGFFGL